MSGLFETSEAGWPCEGCGGPTTLRAVTVDLGFMAGSTLTMRTAHCGCFLGKTPNMQLNNRPAQLKAFRQRHRAAWLRAETPSPLPQITEQDAYDYDDDIPAWT